MFASTRWELVCLATASCLAIAAVNAVTWNEDPKATTNEVGQLMIDFPLPPIFVETGQPEVFELPVVNQSRRKCRMLSVRSSCACAKSELGKYELAPGERTTLRLQANMENRVGPFRLSSHLVTDDPQRPDWILSVTTVVHQAGAFAPSALSLGVIQPDAENSAEIGFLLCAADGRPLPELVSLDLLSNDLRVERLSPHDEQIEGGVRRRIPLRITACGQNRVGSCGSQIVAKYSVHGEVRETRLSVNWTVQDYYKIVPSAVHFGIVGQEKSLRVQKVRVHRPDHRSFNVLEAKSNVSGITCEVEARSSDEKLLTLTLDSNEFLGPLYGEIELVTDDPQHRLLRIGFSAIK